MICLKKWKKLGTSLQMTGLMNIYNGDDEPALRKHATEGVNLGRQ